MNDLTNQVIIVTGANSGIGYEAALDFATRGATLGLVCRSEQRGQQALRSIIKHSGNEDVRLFLADFSQLADIARVAPQILQAYPGLDVLCNNAGSVKSAHQITSEGFEWTLVVNHLSGFLLTQLLLPGLKKAAENSTARIVFTSSLGHNNSAINFDNLNLDKEYSVLRAYGRSKLMNLLTAKELYKRYANDRLGSSSFHPGAVRTAIWGKGGMLSALLGVVFAVFMISQKKGADTLIWLATSTDDASVNAQGGYFFKRKPEKIAGFATDEAAEKLWQVSMGLIAPYLGVSVQGEKESV